MEGFCPILRTSCHSRPALLASSRGPVIRPVTGQARAPALGVLRADRASVVRGTEVMGGSSVRALCVGRSAVLGRGLPLHCWTASPVSAPEHRGEKVRAPPQCSDALPLRKFRRPWPWRLLPVKRLWGMSCALGTILRQLQGKPGIC